MVTHAFTLESSFHGYDFGEEESRCFGPGDYSSVGASLCLAMHELHFLWRQIKREVRLTNGWLKPRRLIEMTGPAAASVLSEKLQLKK